MLVQHSEVWEPLTDQESAKLNKPYIGSYRAALGLFNGIDTEETHTTDGCSLRWTVNH